MAGVERWLGVVRADEVGRGLTGLVSMLVFG